MSISQEIWTFVDEHRSSDVVKLLFSKNGLEGDDLKFAVRQIEGYQYALKKIPSWSANNRLIYPLHLSLEQCSSELTARYKMGLTSGESMIDLTGGFGVDCYFIAQNFKSATYLERSEYLAEVVAENYKTLQADHINCIYGDSTVYLKETTPVDFIFIDPARRGTDGGKLISIADCEPNVVELIDLFRLKTKKLLIKLSPMLDISKALTELQNIGEIHVVAVDNECKELLFLLDFESDIQTECKIICVNLHAKGRIERFDFRTSEEREAVAISTATLGKYLYEPNATILKAGAFNLISERLALQKLHMNSHLYTSGELVEDFPGRTFEVIAVYGFDKKSIKALKTTVDKANISIRNFPATVDSLRKKLAIKDGGEDYLFATTLNNGDKAIIHTRKPNL